LISTIAHQDVAAAAFSPDDTTLAIVGGMNFQLCRASDGGVLHRRALTSGEYCVDFSPDGRFLAFGGSSNSIKLADNTGRILRELPCYSYTHVLAFSPDGTLLASGHSDSVIRLWSLTNGTLRTELRKHGRAVEQLAFSADSRTLLSAAGEGTIRAWSVNQSRDYGVVYRNDMFDEDQLAQGTLCDFSLSADSRRMAVRCYDRAEDDDVLELWDLQEQSPAGDEASQR
jgi:WD40 repeat protein